LIKRDGFTPLLFENKDYNAQIDRNEISKFIIDIEKNECNGIFLSQHSGICNKKNYEIEYHKGFILIYLNFVEYNIDKIRIAVDIIDHLSSKLKLLENNNTITDDLLEYINNEYSIFSSRKEAFLTHLRDSNKKSIDYLTTFELPTLCNYLSTKFATTKLNNYICTLCKNFVGKNKMALASHKKKCNKNYDNLQNNKSISDENISDTIFDENICETIISDENISKTIILPKKKETNKKIKKNTNKNIEI
jgi:hypothetical protein